MPKAVALWRSATTKEKPDGCLHQAPSSHPMTDGPGPTGQRRDRRMEGEKAESEPPEPRNGLE
jgi:hypothetical protein